MVIVAHPDDEVLGCGGALLRLAAEGHEIHVVFLSEGVSSRYEGEYVADAWSDKIEQRESMARVVMQRINAASVFFKRFPNLQMRHLRMLDVVKEIETHVRLHRPATIFTHGFTDMNSDHRIVCEAVLTACRPMPEFPVKAIYAMEISSSTEWNPPGVFPSFQPNLYVDVSSYLSGKLDLLAAYDFEMRPYPHPRSLRAVENLARHRGATVGVEAAEAFSILRQIV